jgi:2',3'-cyclic-nucleotide 2'-phosphodiesterase (5'-nucleotidase family)
LTILHTNDLHGKLDEDRERGLAPLRAGCGLYFDSGDCVRSGNLGVPVRPEPAWERLTRLDCDASVVGNRETHIVPAAFQAKLAGARHPVLCGNLRTKSGGRPLPGTLVLQRGGLKVGVLGVSVAMVTERMAAAAASAYLWDDPVRTALGLAAALRKECDLVVALTHIGWRLDQELAARSSDVDVVLGGHSHTVLERPERVGAAWVCQGGSHGRFVGVYEWDPGSRTLAGGLQPWPGRPGGPVS